MREEREEDRAAVREVHLRAFGQAQEADLVDALRANGGVTLSLVATRDDRVVGHVLFSPVTIGTLGGVGLAPMAVAPAHQRQGIGGALIDAGTRRLRAAGCPFIVVLGHPRYYPRFGFAPAPPRGIKCQWAVPDEAFMLLVLDEARMRGITGVASYRPEFSDRR